VLVEGRGSRVVDAEGREFLDLFAGILTTSIGHSHPEVTERVREQVGRLGHTSTLYITENQISVAKRLAALSPGRLKKTFFTNSGTEAIETAIMLAFLYTGRTELIALRHAYSGRSFFATNITAHASWRPLASSIPGIKHALSPYSYRCPFRSPCDDSCVDAFARDLEEVIQTTTSGHPAALIIEPVQGVGGFIPMPPAYLRRAAEIIRRYGGVFISDEVQTGFGRTGGKWFGIEHAGVEPDIMTMAKGIANGFPVGATITTDEIAAAWTAKSISTYGGTPVSMAAAAATLDVMVREDTPRLSAEQGARLRQGLEALQDRYEWIGDVRGMGLMLALELVEDRRTKEPSARRASALLEAAREEGLLIGLGGLNGNVIRIGPSMLMTPAEIDEGLDRLARACARVQ
jgi:4-aminobutyrate aminotransferase